MKAPSNRPPSLLVRDERAVSPVLATILMVAITVVVAASLFIFSQQLGVGTRPPGTLVFDIHDAQDRVVVKSTSGDLVWDDVEIRLNEDGGWARNANAVTGMAGGTWYPAGTGPIYATQFFDLCLDVAGPLVLEFRNADPGLGITKLTLVDVSQC
jgi:flagellin-like protein